MIDKIISFNQNLIIGAIQIIIPLIIMGLLALGLMYIVLPIERYGIRLSVKERIIRAVASFGMIIFLLNVMYYIKLSGL